MNDDLDGVEDNRLYRPPYAPVAGRIAGGRSMYDDGTIRPNVNKRNGAEDISQLNATQTAAFHVLQLQSRHTVLGRNRPGLRNGLCLRITHRSMVGEGTPPPNVLNCPKPTSSRQDQHDIRSALGRSHRLRKLGRVRVEVGSAHAA